MSKNPCSCIRESFSTEITQLDSQKMIIHDCSDWVVDDGFVFPDSFVVTLTNAKKQTSDHLLVGRSTLVVGNFPDGLYTISLNNCGVLYSSEFLYTATMRCKLDNILLSGDDKKIALALDIEKDLKVAEAAARIGDIKTAEDIFAHAELKLSNVTCDCTC